MKFDADSGYLPKRSELPAIPGAPAGAAWFWGKDDELGRLNLLTPQRRAAAAKLIETGETVGLNLQANQPNPPLFGRKGFQHEIKPLAPGAFDDLYQMNTQSGSQWDGFRHVEAGVEHEGGPIWYNNTTKEDILNTTKCGIQAWAEKGIVGRGVLIDYWNYAKESFDPMTAHPITLASILACAKNQNVTFKPGDILIIRSGWLAQYQTLSISSRIALANNTSPTFAGVEQTEDMLDFLHDNYFSAVAGDAPAFEMWPSGKEWYAHHHLLPRWGCPIGEMWDLEGLAETCRRIGRWEFYLSSMPANVFGGVATVPNAMAIF